MTFQIVNTDHWLSYQDEQMGTKQKVWLQDPDGIPYLLKYPREGSGEDWAEKAVAEIAGLLAIPHAEVELATFQGKRGTISRSFIEGQDGDLWHGNQLLKAVISGYDKDKNFGQSSHTYKRIIQIITGLEATAPLRLEWVPVEYSGGVCFSGYMVLDALVNNTDRHHENWALILTFLRNEDGAVAISGVKLAPTFDHASSLGRELSDERRKIMLDDVERFNRYWSRCPSRIYWEEEDKKPRHPVKLVQLAAIEDPNAFSYWLDRAVTIDMNMISSVFSSFPADWISPCAAEFALKLIMRNLEELNDIHRSLRL